MFMAVMLRTLLLQGLVERTSGLCRIHFPRCLRSSRSFSPEGCRSCAAHFAHTECEVAHLNSWLCDGLFTGQDGWIRGFDPSLNDDDAIHPKDGGPCKFLNWV